VARRASNEGYAAKRAFLQFLVDDLQIFNEELHIRGPLPPEVHPIAILDGMASRSMAMAREGLNMAINDTLEEIANWTSVRREQADELLRQKGLMTTSEALALHSSKVRGILKRARIRSEIDYYLLKGVRDGMGFADPATEVAVNRILADFEDRAVAGKPKGR